jgi:hypothetical protein
LTIIIFGVALRSNASAEYLRLSPWHVTTLYGAAVAAAALTTTPTQAGTTDMPALPRPLPRMNGSFTRQQLIAVIGLSKRS